MASNGRINERGLRESLSKTEAELGNARAAIKTGFSLESTATLDHNVALMKHEGIVLHQRAGDVSTLGTIIMIFRSFIGMGVLALPYAFYKAGWLASSLLLPFFGASMLYSMDLVIRIADDLRFTGSK